MMKNIFLLLLLCGVQLTAQNQIPTDYFSDPLDIPIILAGNFGELRSNHFHSGLDIKTQQRRGLPIYAPADGYVKRIKVGHYGYGKALYVQHPNGYSTVYAHLQKYAGDIQKYVKQQQYEKEEYEVELFPEPTILLVKKGEIIGYTGNTGSSGGPHLHYEFRVDGVHRNSLTYKTPKASSVDKALKPEFDQLASSWLAELSKLDSNYLLAKVPTNRTTL